MKPFACVLVCTLVTLVGAHNVHAWEPDTHAGLTERAAAKAGLHKTLQKQLGVSAGLLVDLIVPPKDAPEITELLRRYPAVHGFVPDRRGRLTALGWLVAGSVLADNPSAHAANHFLNVSALVFAKGQLAKQPLGLTSSTLRGISSRVGNGVLARTAGSRLHKSGASALAWLTSSQNPLGLQGFHTQFEKAVRAKTPAERNRHLAGALVAAGAIVHILQDMGSPSHVRNDLAAHLDHLGRDGRDVGSRFEHLASRIYGRLGVPQAREVIERSQVQDFFVTNKDDGLADIIAKSYFSAHTAPTRTRLDPSASPAEVKTRVNQSLRRANPAITSSLDLFEAKKPRGAVLQNAAGVCLARYHEAQHVLTWSIDDRCAAEQLRDILPRTAAYSAGLLRYLFRGQLTLTSTQTGGISIQSKQATFGDGTLTLFWDDRLGVRTQYAVLEVKAGKIVGPSAANTVPRRAYAVSALYSGSDDTGSTLVAAGYQKLR